MPQGIDPTVVFTPRKLRSLARRMAAARQEFRQLVVSGLLEEDEVWLQWNTTGLFMETRLQKAAHDMENN